MTLTVKAPGTKSLKPECDVPLTNSTCAATKWRFGGDDLTAIVLYKLGLVPAAVEVKEEEVGGTGAGAGAATVQRKREKCPMVWVPPPPSPPPTREGIEPGSAAPAGIALDTDALDEALSLSRGGNEDAPKVWLGGLCLARHAPHSPHSPYSPHHHIHCMLNPRFFE